MISIPFSRPSCLNVRKKAERTVLRGTTRNRRSRASNTRWISAGVLLNRSFEQGRREVSFRSLDGCHKLFRDRHCQCGGHYTPGWISSTAPPILLVTRCTGELFSGEGRSVEG